LFLLAARRSYVIWLYLGNLLDEISYYANKDINSNKDWRWRYKEFNKVSQVQMLIKFWKPLKSFWKDHSFHTD